MEVARESSEEQRALHNGDVLCAGRALVFGRRIIADERKKARERERERKNNKRRGRSALESGSVADNPQSSREEHRLRTPRRVRVAPKRSSAFHSAQVFVEFIIFHGGRADQSCARSATFPWHFCTLVIIFKSMGFALPLSAHSSNARTLVAPHARPVHYGAARALIVPPPRNISPKLISPVISAAPTFFTRTEFQTSLDRRGRLRESLCVRLL